jgi:hypothetical protein
MATSTNNPMTSFPAGFSAGLSVRGMPILQTQTGNVFWVDNGTGPTNVPGIANGSDGPSAAATNATPGKGTYNRPFASIANALKFCAQGNGDIIFLKPGHRETVNGAGTTTQPVGAGGTALALNVNGVAIIGLGTGDNRPTITLATATTANILLQASNVSIQNVLFKTNFAAVVSAFTAVTASVTASIAANTNSNSGTMTVTVLGSGTLYPGMGLKSATSGFVDGTFIVSQLTGTAGGVGTYLVSASQTVASGTIVGCTRDFDIEYCEFKDLSSSLNLLSIFTDSAVTNACDGFRFVGNRISSLGTTAATTALIAGANQDRWTITDNYGNWAVLNNTAAMLAAGANSITQFEFSRNAINRPNTSTTSGLAISTSGTAWTGQCNDNRIWGLNGTTQIWINTGTKLAFNQNFCTITGAADKSGLINPAAA